MLKNYFITAWRNLVKNKGGSIINIGGLAIGIAVAILISLWTIDELSFNKYHLNFSRIARVMENRRVDGAVRTGKYLSMPVAPELRKSFAEDFKYVIRSTFSEEHTIANAVVSINRTGMFMEANGPEMLTLKMLKGVRTGLKGPYSIMLSKSLASALFDKVDAINRTLKVDNNSDVIVTGIYEDLPANSDFSNISYIAPFDLYLISNPGMQNWKADWNNNFLQVFVQLAPSVTFDEVSEKMKDVKLDHSGADSKTLQPQLLLHPMNKWHLYNEFKNGVNTGGAIQFVYLFGIIGVFVLMVACINFISSSAAGAEKRAREIGIRRAIGSGRYQLIYQFLGEAVLIVFLSFILAVAIVQLFLPLFNEVVNKQLHILWTNSLFWLLSIGFILITGLIAGSYPALYLSSFQPVEVLKGCVAVRRFASLPHQVLVVIHFKVTISFIIGTIIVVGSYQRVC